MIRTTTFATGLLVAIAGLTALSLACARSSSPWPLPSATANLTEDEAVETAFTYGGHLTQDRKIQRTTTHYTTYAAAYDVLDFDTPLPGSARPSGETPVWVVTFKGMFYEPQGPAPDPPVTPRARKPACSEVVVLIPDGVEPDSPDFWADVTFLPAGSCS